VFKTVKVEFGTYEEYTTVPGNNIGAYLKSGLPFSNGNKI